MKVEIELTELLQIKSWATYVPHIDWCDMDSNTMMTIDYAIEQAQELEELDLDDCASGACKL